MRSRRTIAAVAGTLILLAAAYGPHPHADIRIMTHEAGDAAPGRMQAAIDVGIVAVSLLVTWTKRSVN